MGRQAGRAPRPVDGEPDFDVRQRQQAGSFFRPLDQTDGLLVEVFAEPSGIPFFRINKSVQIKVIQV